MLFNSYIFIFLFLPICMVVFFELGRRDLRRVAIAWLVTASLFFYAWWNPRYLPLIAGSILFNYVAGLRLSACPKTALAKRLLIAAISVNLLVLAYYKYSGFLDDNLNAILGMSLLFHKPGLPLGISFFTFTQIAYLADTYRGETKEYRSFDYSLFVVFFPHLIAGPILHHKGLIPQFEQKRIYRFSLQDFSVGLSFFVIGLYKKTVLADGISKYSTTAFQSAAAGDRLGFYQAWGGALAYTLQIYFDFSGYSDMAIGLARMFGIMFPVNFNSPYKALNIADFWRRWHITLSTFLRDYLYIPLGGNRKGPTRRHLNLFTTMLLGGLWHGASWTFVIWGALHGFYLIVNHAWRHVRAKYGYDANHSDAIWRMLARGVTFVSIVIAWVVFRAPTIGIALAFIRDMANWHEALLGPSAHSLALRELLWIIALLSIAWFLPNTQQLLAHFNPATEITSDRVTRAHSRKLIFQPNCLWALFMAGVFVTAVLHLSRITEFLYFQF